MRKFQLNFIELIASALFERKIEIKDVDFEETERLSVSHYCLPMVYQGAVLSGLNPPQSWKDASLIIGMNNYKKLIVQDKALKVLRENKIECAVIKGTSAAVNYKNPTYRPLGDIDILVKECDFEKAVNIFGQTLENNKHKFHLGFLYEGVSLEIHKSIDDLSNCKNGEKISEVMKSALDEVQFLKYDGFEFPALKNKYQALMYINHMVRHLDENNISMRMFCDWVMFVSSLNDKEWNEEIYPVIERIGFTRFVDALNIAADKYLNAGIGNRAKYAVSPKVIDELIEEMTFVGKKGSPDFLDGNIASVYMANTYENMSAFKKYIKVLNSISYRRFEIAKHKIALPFCWGYIIIGYLFNVITGKHKKLSVKTINYLIKRRNYIKKELEI